jgi:glutathione peroxidase
LQFPATRLLAEPYNLAMSLHTTLTLCSLALCCALTACVCELRPTDKETPAMPAQPARASVPPVLDFTMNRLVGEPAHLGDYQGKVVLIVNVASKCGYTPQYAPLQKLHETYHERGLAVLGFPANEFGNQEPGTDADIAEFCERNFGATFDMFSKVVVKGDGICPLYDYLTSEETNPEFGGEMKWNFEKFLIGRDGRVVNRFGSRTSPDSDEMIAAIEAALGEG